MKRLILKTLKATAIASVFIFPIFAHAESVPNTNNNTRRYIWNESKAMQSKQYMEKISNVRDEKLRKTLEIENTDVYLENMDMLYNLSLKLGKVDEVEEIMTEYEKDQIFYELLLLTENEELATIYRDDPELHFKFYRVIS